MDNFLIVLHGGILKAQNKWKKSQKMDNLYPLEKFLYTNVYQIKCNDKLERKDMIKKFDGNII